MKKLFKKLMGLNMSLGLLAQPIVPGIAFLLGAESVFAGEGHSVETVPNPHEGAKSGLESQEEHPDSCKNFALKDQLQSHNSKPQEKTFFEGVLATSLTVQPQTQGTVIKGYKNALYGQNPLLARSGEMPIDNYSNRHKNTIKLLDEYFKITNKHMNAKDQATALDIVGMDSDSNGTLNLRSKIDKMRAHLKKSGQNLDEFEKLSQQKLCEEGKAAACVGNNCAKNWGIIGGIALAGLAIWGISSMFGGGGKKPHKPKKPTNVGIGTGTITETSEVSIEDSGAPSAPAPGTPQNGTGSAPGTTSQNVQVTGSDSGSLMPPPPPPPPTGSNQTPGSTRTNEAVAENTTGMTNPPADPTTTGQPQTPGTINPGSSVVETTTTPVSLPTPVEDSMMGESLVQGGQGEGYTVSAEDSGSIILAAPEGTDNLSGPSLGNGSSSGSGEIEQVDNSTLLEELEGP